MFRVLSSSDRSGTLRGTLSLVLLVALAAGVTAQSGRRLPKTAPTPAPKPTPEAETVKKPASSKEPELSLIVGIDDHNTFHIPMYYTSAVLDGCAATLRNSGVVRLEGANRNFNRGEAVNRAKAEKETYVVLLELQLDSFGRRQGLGNVNVDDLYISYWVFTPGTAKVKTSGRTYPQTHRRVGIGIPGGGRGAVYAEYLLKEASREAAERILDAFHLKPRRLN